ncbi:MAG: hypothetical protein KDA20_12960 [Phycisphaerales bacterium]|nr:hypothetical protein [Phycisphaerales bacterium]
MLRKLFNLLLLGSGVSGIEREDPVARTERMRQHAGGETDPFFEDRKSREELLDEVKRRSERPSNGPPATP